MLDIKQIRQNPEKVKEDIKNRGMEIDIDKLLELDKQKRELQQQAEKLRAKRNELSYKTKEGKPTSEQIKEGKEIKEKLTQVQEKLEKTKEQYNELLYEVPNLIAEEVPVGPDDSGNKVVRKYKEPTKFDFEPRDHMELGKMHGIIDTELSAEISGPRFNYLFREAVLLQFALVQFVFDVLTDKEIIKELAQQVGNPSYKPFIPVVPPVMAKSNIMKKMDRFDPIEDRYYLKEDELLLVGSAEHTMGPIHINDVFKEEDLPVRYIGYSTAFRREAGSYGKDTAGILRRHQFDKAEMETFSVPDNGKSEQDLIVAIQEYLVKQLDLPYQVVMICTGDMGKPDYRQIDVECYMPGQDKYRETHTSDYMTDYQSRRLNIKCKKKEGSKEFVHMNDATAFAIGRILVAILENNQQEDGSIVVPEVLRKYMPRNIEVVGKNKE